MTYFQHHNQFEVVTLMATDHSAGYAHTVHRVVLQAENEGEYVGWPDPTDRRNSTHWKPGIDQPLTYPKFAWKAYR